MGKNKGKGSSNLRRLNAIKKRKNDFEKLHDKIISQGLPSVSFCTTPKYTHISYQQSEELKEIK